MGGWWAKKARASSQDSSSTSAMVLPRKVTSRVSRLYRAPWHTSQGT